MNNFESFGIIDYKSYNSKLISLDYRTKEMKSYTPTYSYDAKKNHIKKIKRIEKDTLKTKKNTILSLTTPKEYKSFMDINKVTPECRTLLYPLFLLLMFPVFYIFGDPVLIAATFGVLSADFYVNNVEIFNENFKLSTLSKKIKNKWQMQKDTKNFINNNSTLPELYNKWRNSDTQNKMIIETIWKDVIKDEWNLFILHQEALANVERKNILESQQKIYHDIENLRNEKNKEIMPILKEISSSK